MAMGLFVLLQMPDAAAQMFRYGSYTSVRQIDQQRMIDSRRHAARTINRSYIWSPYYTRNLIRHFMARLRRALAVIRRQHFNNESIREQVRRKMEATREQMRLQQSRRNALTVNHQDRLRQTRDRTAALMQQQKLRLEQMMRR